MASSPSDSPPSPPSTDSPPPQSSSSPPPASSPPPPPPPSSSPPPQSSPPPPSPSDSNSSPPPPPPPSPKSSSSPPYQNSSPPPPPPPKSNSRGNASPPPPSLAPPKSHRSSQPADKPSSNSGGNAISTPVIIGVVAAAGFLLLIAMVALCFACTKKKKKKTPHDQMQYYMDPPSRGDQYYNGSQHGNNNWAQSPMGHSLQISPPPGAIVAWPPPPPPPGMVSSDMSSANFSGPHGPVLPPPHPSVALGFNKSTFTYDELAAATGGFARGNLLGQGGFGYVHKGTLPNGKEIAVKSLKSGSGQGEREFQAEVDIISRVHHRHLVSLVGYCIAGGQRMLVYEFVPNNNLEHHLYAKGRAPLDWPTRLKIAVGSAKGLAYLHEDCHPRIIHRDIKTANILIDYSYEAKVADFGLAKLSQDNYTHVSTRVMGTFGYLAPEYASTGKLTEKSDVFSFGVMLLELITGRRPVDTSNHYMEDSLVDWARPLLSRALEDGNYDEFADPLMEKNYVPHEMARMVACAAASIRHSGRRRPKMSQIVRALEGDAVLDDLNEGVKPGQSSVFGSSSSENDASSYSADMKKFRKMALDSQEYGSSEYGGTSEYGLHPSSSSNDSSREMAQNVGSRRRSP